MAVAYLLEFESGTVEEYDQVMEALDLGGKAAPGALFHLASPAESGGLRIVDVWESEEAANAFYGGKLAEATAQQGGAPPKVTPWPVHNIITP